MLDGLSGMVVLRISLDFARDAICPEGSDPMERMQMRGVRGSDSSQVASRLRIEPSPYSGPRESILLEILH